jgi:hypothetical protein
MRPPSKVVACAIAVSMLALGWRPGADGVVTAQEGAKPARSARGGALASIGAYRFEVFFYTTGLRVFPEDGNGAPLDAAKLTGTATFYHPNSPEPWFARPLHPSAAPGRASESLELALDLSTVPPTGARVAFEISGLPSPADPVAKFTLPFEFVKTPAESNEGCPVTAEVHGYAPIASKAYYFPLAGFYSTPTGVVWVPAPGYYHARPTQLPVIAASGWLRAHPAPEPRRFVSPGWTGAPTSIHPQLYWRPRAWGDTESYQAWLQGMMRMQQAAGRSPAIVGGECAQWHRR